MIRSDGKFNKRKGRALDLLCAAVSNDGSSASSSMQPPLRRTQSLPVNDKISGIRIRGGGLKPTPPGVDANVVKAAQFMGVLPGAPPKNNIPFSYTFYLTSFIQLQIEDMINNIDLIISKFIINQCIFNVCKI